MSDLVLGDSPFYKVEVVWCYVMGQASLESRSPFLGCKKQNFELVKNCSKTCEKEKKVERFQKILIER